MNFPQEKARRFAREYGGVAYIYEIYTDIVLRWEEFQRSGKSFTEWLEEWDNRRGERKEYHVPEDTSYTFFATLDKAELTGKCYMCKKEMETKNTVKRWNGVQVRNEYYQLWICEECEERSAVAC